MKKVILKKIIYSILLILIVLMMSTISEAATLSITPSKSEVTIGETFTVTITAGNGAGRIDVSATNATLSSSGDFLDNSSITITVTPTATGTVTVTATGVLSDYTIEEDQNFSKSVSVNVKEKQVTPPPVTPQEPEQPEPPKVETPQVTEPKSSNANLKSITISQEGLTPSFNKATTDYVLTVGNDVNDIQIDAIPEDSKAKVTVSGNTELIEGENTVKIVVKAEDGSTKTYKITVIKAARMDMLLDKLEILGISDEKDDIEIKLTPEFKSEIFYYTLDIEENIKSLSINATSVVDDAIIEIKGNEELQEGENIITITLKMPEGEEKIEYKIVANKGVNTLDNTLETTDEQKEDESWLTVEVKRILITVFVSIIAISGIAFGVIEYRYTKQNPKDKKNKKEKKKDKDKFENEELNDINYKVDDDEPKKVGKSGKHF